MDMRPLHLGQLRAAPGLHHFRDPGVLHFDDCRTIRVAADASGGSASLSGGGLSGAACDLYCDGIIHRCRTIALQAAVHVAGIDRGADWDPGLLRLVAKFGPCENGCVDLAAKEKPNGWQICWQPSR